MCSWELQHKQSTTKDHLSLCFLSQTTHDIWKTPFQTYIYHVDGFGHIFATIFSFLFSPILPSTLNPQIITLCGPFLMPSACVFSKIDTVPVTTVIIMSFGMVALVEVLKITAFQQTNFMNVFRSCRLPASEASCSSKRKVKLCKWRVKEACTGNKYTLSTFQMGHRLSSAHLLLFLIVFNLKSSRV